MAQDSKLHVSFSLGRNKTIYVVGEYDHSQTSTEDRLEYWGIVNQFGQQLGVELSENYSVGLFRIVLCESDPGYIAFEIETDAPASIRRKAIESLQERFDTEEKSVPTYPVNGPDTAQ